MLAQDRRFPHELGPAGLVEARRSGRSQNARYAEPNPYLLARYVLLTLFLLLVTVNEPSRRAETLIHFAWSPRTEP